MNGSRILVTDAQDRSGLAAIRCLHAACYRVTATATSRGAPGLWSRGCSAKRILPDPQDGVDGYIAQLEELVRDDRHDVMLPGRDETLYAVSTRRRRLAPYVEMGLPGPEVVERALNKAWLATEAARVGLPTPEARVCTRLEDALDVVEAFGFPVFVKPIRTVVEVAGRLVRYPSRFVVDEPGLRDAQQHMGTCIVQRREEGNVIAFAGVATERGLLGSVVSRYRRTWPPLAGQASFSTTITAPARLTEQVGSLVEAIGWRGLFQLQLIECEDGAIRAIDFNPRLYGSMSLARAAGAPLASLWCAWLLGQDPKPVRARAGVSYRYERGDARHILWQIRARHYRQAAAALSPRRDVTHAYFLLRDPLPLLALGAGLAQRRWPRPRGRAALRRHRS
jgi:D-aspartate ligase